MSSQHFICDTLQSGYSLTISKSLDCASPSSYKPIEKVELEVFVRNAQPHTLAAYSCYKIIDTVCTYQSVVWGKSILDKHCTLEAVDADTCANAAKNWIICKHSAGTAGCEFKAFNTTLREIDNATAASNHVLSIKYKWCCYEDCNSVASYEFRHRNGNNRATEWG